MKISRLCLHAFGPFTDAEIDFDNDRKDSTTNLHLIYGPNEAGKSSALRAITDLRFGIPLRSSDDFLHPSKNLRISGVFIDADGNPIGLTRRKARKSALLYFDPTSGDQSSAVDAEREHVQALTGGLDRDEFEAMFGLNHSRLREGGARLLKGEGELGSALFEASAGTRGIDSILAGLDADAKKIFNSHGHAKGAIINEARRALDEQRKALKVSQTKPADWQVLNRAHEKARDISAKIEEDLEKARRRENELTELRTVMPLLREYDRAQASLQELAGVPDLSEDVRETRLFAEQTLKRAIEDLSNSQLELDRCTRELEELVIEEPLLKHAATIERLSGNSDSVQQCRIETRQLQAEIDKLTQEIRGQLVRVAPDTVIQDVLSVVPSDADRVALDEHLSALPLFNDRLDGLQNRLEELISDAKDDIEHSFSLPDINKRQRIDIALADAQALGNIASQLSENGKNIDKLKVDLRQGISDLSVSDADALRKAKPLLDSQINSMHKLFIQSEELEGKLVGEDQRLSTDLAEQQLRIRTFLAAGEMVTADTLHIARTRRDEGWASIRKAYVERTEDPGSLAERFGGGRSLPEAFESAQDDADHQADFLRADATRAAGYESCAARIEQMETRRCEIVGELGKLADRRQVLNQQWLLQVSEANLPALDPTSLREWQAKRQGSLDIASRLESLETAREKLLTAEEKGIGELAAALQNVGQDTQALTLESLIAHASRWVRDTTASEAAHLEREKSASKRKVELKKIETQISKTNNDLQNHLDAIDAWSIRLLLDSGASAESVKARLNELDSLVRKCNSLGESSLKQAQSQAKIDAYENQAAKLATSLEEQMSDLVEDFVSQLQQRLQVSKNSDEERRGLLRDQKRAAQAIVDSNKSKSKQSGIISKLCENAGVPTVELLVQCEEKSFQKRRFQASLANQKNQLEQASTRSEEELRGRLTGLDAIAIEAEQSQCQELIKELKLQYSSARHEEETTRHVLEAIDSSDAAAQARESMESIVARYSSAIRPWARLRLARALLQESLKRFRERAQAPMIASASTYFSLMTNGRYPRLIADDAHAQPVLLAERKDGVTLCVDAMSEGTADQLYLALRLAALDMRRQSHTHMPLVLDDVLITSDDERASNILRSLARFSEGGQVMLFTHHRHLIDIANKVLDSKQLAVHTI